ncbi:ketosteroid isomerase-related protein [Deinococcus sp.]|uniref:ketosteroid isomerase-related protein n=1 Tax=Deinococcus sp. TaxID=47478 RepID=UPI002869A2F4|nr:ketosteroid isomerase-related protein [Deinococcus sp.]
MGTEVTLRGRGVRRVAQAAILPGMTDATVSLVRAYYAAFNAQDTAGMLALLTDDVRHDINEGPTQTGMEAFRAFLARMDEHYRERAEDLVVMASGDGLRAAAEFTIHGTYVKTDDGLPEASGQTYVLPVGAFFDVRGGRIARVTNHYNLAEWSRQVSGGPGA